MADLSYREWLIGQALTGTASAPQAFTAKEAVERAVLLADLTIARTAKDKERKADALHELLNVIDADGDADSLDRADLIRIVIDARECADHLRDVLKGGALEG